jgi:UDP-N-acetyl-D-mannosaminuronic acid dehydrogenase
MSAIARAGFAAGPCLAQGHAALLAFCGNQFSLGSGALRVNQGLPLFLVEQLERRQDLGALTVGLLGMAFKSNSDDTRSSLAYTLKGLLEPRCRSVLTSDPHVANDSALKPLDEVVAQSDLLILCVPHEAYRNLDRGGQPVIDVWNFLGKGSLI